MIRQIIQTWKSTDLSDANPLFQISSSSWQAQHPDWVYRLVDDEYLATFTRERVPVFYRNTFSRYEAQIQRVDIFRIVYMFFEGGLYSDLDAEALRPFDLGDDRMSEIVLGSLANMENGQHIPNAFLYSGVTRSAFWAFVLAVAEERFQKTRGYDGPEYLTGPALLTHCYYTFKRSELDNVKKYIEKWTPELSELIAAWDTPIHLLSPEVIYPIDWTTCSAESINHNLAYRLKNGLPPPEFCTPDTICINYWTHSWDIPERGPFHTIKSKVKWLSTKIRNLIKYA